MATYKGGELPKPDQVDEDVRRSLPRLPGMENIEEELNLPEEVGPDYVPRPGEKHYKEQQHMAEKWIHEDGPRVGYETFTRPGQATADKLNNLPLKTLQDYVRPLRPGEKANLKEDPDETNAYARGGKVLNRKSYAKRR